MKILNLETSYPRKYKVDRTYARAHGLTPVNFLINVEQQCYKEIEQFIIHDKRKPNIRSAQNASTMYII